MITRTDVSKADWSEEETDIYLFEMPSALTNLVNLLSTDYVLEGEPSDTNIVVVCDEGDARFVYTFTGTVFEMHKLYKFACKFREISESSPVVIGVVPGMTAFDHQTDVMRIRHDTSCAALISLLPEDDYTNHSRQALIDLYLAL